MLFFTVVLVSFISYSEQLCEESSTPISNLTFRGINNTNTVLDDMSWNIGWYSAVDGGIQYLISSSETPIGFYRCGVAYPSTVKGAHPDLNSLTEEPIDFEVWVGDTIFNVTTVLKVRKCNGEIQYYSPEDATCSCGLCFEPSNVTISTSTEPEQLCKESSTPISNLTFRGINNTNTVLNDISWTIGWYSAVDGGIQYLISSSETPIGSDRCGVTYPLTVKGAHPDLNSLTEEPIDFEVWFGDGTFNVTSVLKVRKCNGEIQYYSPEDAICSCGLCFEPSNVTISTSTEPAPTIKTELKFLKQGNPSSQEDIIPYILFRCDFTNIPGRFYTVTWYINNKPMVTHGPSNDIDDFLLHENTLLNFTAGDVLYGKKIKCSVSLLSADNSNAISVTTQSVPVPVAAELDSTTVYISKNGIGSIKVKFTAPVGCGYTVINNEAPASKCQYSLKLYMKNDWSCSTSGLVNLLNHPLENKFCTEPIKMLEKSSDWKQLTWEHVLKIITTDLNYDDNTEFTLRLMFDDSIVHKLWKNFLFPDIKVKVLTENMYMNKVCYSHVDPHMRTADHVYYGQQQPGSYMLYKNEKYKIEIQEQVKQCFYAGTLRCACGIAIRAGSDVFMINLCGSINYMDFTQCNDGGILNVLQISSSNYRVMTPIGTRIDIVKNTHLPDTLNIDVFMAPKDEGNVVGLCGKFDGTKTGELVHRDGKTVSVHSFPFGSYDVAPDFVNSWRLTDDENLFLRHDRPLDSWVDINQQYCVCLKPGSLSGETICSSTQDLGCKDRRSITDKKCLIKNRKKRSSTVRHEEELLRLFSIMNQERNKQPRKKRSVEYNITTEDAAGLCSAINSSLSATDYTDVSADENTSVVILQCTLDVVEGNDASFVQVHIDATNSLVKNIIELSPSYAENNTDKVQYFLANSCPANCSGNGICSVNGTCICTDRYSGADCSIDKSEPLNIDDVEGGGVCDIGKGNDCQCFVLRTDNLLEDFNCIVTVYEVSYNRSLKKLWTGITQGEYHDIFTGVCCVSDGSTSNQTTFYALKYEFAISNDGIHYGASAVTYIFNSDCQDPRTTSDGSAYVLLKDGFCFAEQTNIEENTTSNTCSSCNPAHKVYDCSNVCRNEPADDTKKKVIIGVVTSVGGLLAVGIIVWIARKFCFQKKVTPNVNLQNHILTHSKNLSGSNYMAKNGWSLQTSTSKEFQQPEKNPFPVNDSFQGTGPRGLPFTGVLDASTEADICSDGNM